MDKALGFPDLVNESLEQGRVLMHPACRNGSRSEPSVILEGWGGSLIIGPVPPKKQCCRVAPMAVILLSVFVLPGIWTPYNVDTFRGDIIPSS